MMTFADIYEPPRGNHGGAYATCLCGVGPWSHIASWTAPCGPNFRARAQRMNKAAEYRKNASEARERVAQSFSNSYCDHWTDLAYFWAELAAVEECLWPEALGMSA